MTSQHLTLVPIGGLANRLRAIVSAYALARATGMRLEVIWLRNRDLNAPFEALFEPPGHGIALTECSAVDAVLRYNIPRKRNLYLTALYQRRHFDTCLYEHCTRHLLDNDTAWEELVTGKNAFISSGQAFYSADETLFRELFTPTAEIAEAVRQRCAAFTAPTIGVHIRRTDNHTAIAESPITLFIERIEQEMARTPETWCYVATDSEEVKGILREHFGHRILTSPSQASRRSVEGMKEAVVELYTLAATDRFYGSSYSSFSDLALLLSDRPGEILRKEICK